MILVIIYAPLGKARIMYFFTVTILNNFNHIYHLRVRQTLQGKCFHRAKHSFTSCTTHFNQADFCNMDGSGEYHIKKVSQREKDTICKKENRMIFYI